MGEKYSREQLADIVARSDSWAGVLRALGRRPSGGARRAVQRAVRDLGIDAGHFRRSAPWRTYSDEAIAEAVASATTLREVAVGLGAVPATGTLSHLRRRIATAGLDIRHFPALGRTGHELPCTPEEMRATVPGVRSLRVLAGALGLDEEDSASRAALRRGLAAHGIDTSHFAHARLALPEGPLRAAVAASTGYAGAMRALGLPVNDANHRRLLRQVARLGIDTSHFTRRSTRAASAAPRPPVAGRVLRRLPPGSPRPNRERLARALDEIGRARTCAECGNDGEWRGRPMTLHIDHVNGDWLDNRRENLRYLCPNCHAITPTWCRRKGRAGRVGHPQSGGVPAQ